MSLEGKVGFIGGGRMGEALIKGILQANVFSAEQIIVSEPDSKRCDYLSEKYAIEATTESTAVWKECGIIILAVKPQIMGDVLISAKDKINNNLIISIAAGISIKFIEDIVSNKQCRVIRVMPNTPALVLEAASALSPGASTTEDDMQKASTIFNAIGKSVVVDEKYMDAVTGLSGSGPAYVFSFIEALIDAGLKVGLTREVAETLVLQTVLGSVKLAIDSKEHPAQLRAMVTSPGGTTIAGLHELEIAGFNGILMDAVEAAARRSEELGKSD